jgi:hypothetical protein
MWGELFHRSRIVALYTYIEQFCKPGTGRSSERYSKGSETNVIFTASSSKKIVEPVLENQ